MQGRQFGMRNPIDSSAIVQEQFDDGQVALGAVLLEQGLTTGIWGIDQIRAVFDGRLHALQLIRLGRSKRAGRPIPGGTQLGRQARFETGNLSF